MAPELASSKAQAKIDPARQYGVQWYNRQKVRIETVSEPDGDGARRYKKRRTFVWRPREEWVAVPVPASLDRDLVERARAMAAANRGSERKYLARAWELRGLVRCSCGLKMATQTTSAKASRPYYYGCNRSKDYGTDACSRKAVPAQKGKHLVWGFVFGLLKDPERVRAGMEALIDRERETGIRRPAKEAAGWAEKLHECDRLRSAYQDQQAAGLMTLGEELGSKLKRWRKRAGWHGPNLRPYRPGRRARRS